MREITQGRRTGRTTKLVNWYIDQLITRGTIILYDHHDSEKSNKLLLDKFLLRLWTEHSIKQEHLKISNDLIYFAGRHPPVSIEQPIRYFILIKTISEIPQEVSESEYEKILDGFTIAYQIFGINSIRESLEHYRTAKVLTIR